MQIRSDWYQVLANDILFVGHNQNWGKLIITTGALPIKPEYSHKVSHIFLPRDMLSCCGNRHYIADGLTTS